MRAGPALIRPRTPLLGFGLRQLLNYVRGGYREMERESETMLQEQGILRPETEWYTGELKTAVDKVRLLIVGVLSLISVTLMYVGDGDVLTWVGSIAFLLSMFSFTWISIRPAADPMPGRSGATD